MNRKFFILFLILTLAFNLCSCEGGKKEKKGPEDKYTDVFQAVDANDAAAVEGFIKDSPGLYGERNNKGLTPLLMAAKLGKLQAVKVLSEEPKALNMKDGQGKTPLSMAAKNGHAEVTRFLLKKGADINHKDDKGNTPLHLAVKNEKINIVQLLLKRGADSSLKNSDGMTPLGLAKKQGLEDYASLLQTYRVTAVTDIENDVEQIKKRLEKKNVKYKVDIEEEIRKKPMGYRVAFYTDDEKKLKEIQKILKKVDLKRGTKNDEEGKTLHYIATGHIRDEGRADLLSQRLTFITKAKFVTEKSFKEIPHKFTKVTALDILGKSKAEQLKKELHFFSQKDIKIEPIQDDSVKEPKPDTSPEPTDSPQPDASPDPTESPEPKETPAETPDTPPGDDVDGDKKPKEGKTLAPKEKPFKKPKKNGDKTKVKKDADTDYDKTIDELEKIVEKEQKKKNSDGKDKD